MADKKKAITSKRISAFDLLRGCILLFMVFTNAYYALSKQQIHPLAHDLEVAAPGDVIIVYFFMMIGFNLSLVMKFKKQTTGRLLLYASKRAGLIAGIGAVLISYTFLLYGLQPVLFLRSFLIVLAGGMFLTALLIFITAANVKIMWLVTLVTASGLLAWQPQMPGGYRFVTPFFLLSSLFGYLTAEVYFNRKRIFRDIAVSIGVFSLAGAVLLYKFEAEIPSRQAMNLSFFLLSWGAVLVLLGLAAAIKAEKIKGLGWLLRSGAHPLSFWVIQSLMIGIAVFTGTLVYYFQNDLLQYFWSAPVYPRMIQNHTAAIVVSVIVSIITVAVHLLYIRKFGREKYKIKKQ